MLGGLVEKISASLGKSFLFAGLLPAAVMLMVWSFYWYGSHGVWSQIETVAASGEEAESISWLGLVWVCTGFILFGIRTWLFALFRILPTGRAGSLMLRRHLRHRERAREKRSRLEWQLTVATWHKRRFATASAKYRPPWYPVPAIADALHQSANARARLRVKNKRVYPSWKDRSVLLDGLAQLFAIITDNQIYKGHKDEIDAELALWSTEAASPNAAAFLENLAEEINRDWAKAYARYDKYPKGIWIYPTIIGNHLAALDDYAERRYGITTDTIWERLWWVLPPRVKDEISDARLAVEVAINLGAALLIAAAAITGVEIARIGMLPGFPSPGGGVGRSASLIFGSILLTAIMYRCAVFALDSLASKMRTLIDFYRLQLIVDLGLRPNTMCEESELWSELNHFFVQATPRRPERKLTLPKPQVEKSDERAAAPESQSTGSNPCGGGGGGAVPGIDIGSRQPAAHP